MQPTVHGLRRATNPKEAFRDLDFSRAHKDRVLVGCAEDGSCSLWETQAGTQLSRLELPEGAHELDPFTGACTGRLWPHPAPLHSLWLRWTRSMQGGFFGPLQPCRCCSQGCLCTSRHELPARHAWGTS